jgi:methyl-accepting chemotaxis protein
MIHKHAGEDVSFHMATDFPGVYGTLATGVNTMIYEHLDAIMEAIVTGSAFLHASFVSNVAREIPTERDIAYCFGRIDGVLPRRGAAGRLP